jgi:hypothetical protein
MLASRPGFILLTRLNKQASQTTRRRVGESKPHGLGMISISRAFSSLRSPQNTSSPPERSSRLWRVLRIHRGLFKVPNDGIISAKNWGSDMLARRYHRRLARRAVSIAPKKLARTRLLIPFPGIWGLSFAGQGCHSKKSTNRPPRS